MMGWSLLKLKKTFQRICLWLFGCLSDIEPGLLEVCSYDQGQTESGQIWVHSIDKERMS